MNNQISLSEQSYHVIPFPHNPLKFSITLPNPNPNFSPTNPTQFPSRKRRRLRTLPPPLDPTPQMDTSDDIVVINREPTAEALIALSAGFPADSLTDQEVDAAVVPVVGGIEQVNYTIIRNHIIARWRENVSQWVSKEMFVPVIPPRYSSILDSAYDYLVHHGYINFGVSPAIKDRVALEPFRSKVVVIGAGLAGLAAARQLMIFGFKVTVLEGRKRAGGRVYTKKMEGADKMAFADLGGSVLTGTLGNPLGIIARQLSYSLNKVRDRCPIYCTDGKPVNPDIDMKVETMFNRILDKASEIRQLMGEVSVDISLGSALETFWQVNSDTVTKEEMNLFNWHLANLEYANAGLLSNLSLAFWDQDDPYDMGGDHCLLPGGNGNLIHALAENVPILYERTVHTIRYGSGGVQVMAGSQVFEADMVLCTMPLGVLKSGSVKFVPELPQRKLDGIKRLGFGLLNKVAMLFPHVFWSTDFDTFGHLAEDPSQRGEFFLFYSYAFGSSGPLLIALVAGEAAHKFETMPPTDAVTKVLQILRGIYEPQGIDVPEPIQTVCTRWGSDPFCLGSYSNVAVGASGDDYDILAESVGDGTLFFAGEATNRRYPATMHGAFLSGLREAANMSHHAKARNSKIKVEKTPKNAHPYASLLADFFRNSDLEFGSFSVIFGKNVNDAEPMAILRVAFNEARKKSADGSKPDQQHSNKLLFQQLQSHFNQQQELHVYTLLMSKQVLELREVRGGDEMRLNYLCENLGVKLVGRKGLGPAADSVIASVKAERGNRKSTSDSISLKSGATKLKTGTLKQKMIRRAKVVGKSLISKANIGPTSNYISTSLNNTVSFPNSNIVPSPNNKLAQPSTMNIAPSLNINTGKLPNLNVGSLLNSEMDPLPNPNTSPPSNPNTSRLSNLNMEPPSKDNMSPPPNSNMDPLLDVIMGPYIDANMGPPECGYLGVGYDMNDEFCLNMVCADEASLVNPEWNSGPAIEWDMLPPPQWDMLSPSNSNLLPSDVNSNVTSSPNTENGHPRTIVGPMAHEWTIFPSDDEHKASD